MKTRIPDDWDGITYDCVQIQWPASLRWRVLLIGLLETITIGRYWDERSGSIIGIQQIAESIFRLNYPFTTCDGETIVVPPQGAAMCGGVLVLDEENDMAITDVDFNCETGILTFKSGMCCVKEIDLSCLLGTAPGGGTDYELPDDTDPDATGIYPCGMAVAVGNLLANLGGYIWDEADNTFPAYMPVKAQNYIGLNLNDIATVNAANQALIMKGTVIISGTVVDLEKSDVIPSTLSADVACHIVPLMQPDGTVDTTDLWDAIRAYFLAKYPISESGNNIFIQNYWMDIRNAIGSGNFRDVAKAGALVDGGDCECPGVYDPGETEPTEGGWYLSNYQADIVAMLAGEGEANLWHFATVPHDIYGLMFEMYIDGTWQRIKRAGDCSFPSLPEDHCLNSATSESLSDSTAYGQIGPNASADLMPVVPHTQLNLGGPFSDTINTPLAAQGDSVQWRIIVEGNEGDVFTATCRFRWLHNINSPSHQ